MTDRNDLARRRLDAEAARLLAALRAVDRRIRALRDTNDEAVMTAATNENSEAA